MPETYSEGFGAWDDWTRALIAGDISHLTVSEEEQRMLNAVRGAISRVQERVTLVEKRLNDRIKKQEEFIDEMLAKMERFSQVLVEHKQYKMVGMKYMPAIKEIHGFDAKTISAVNENFKEILATLGEFIIYTDNVDMRKEELPEQGTVIDDDIGVT